jgi:hypothetical protein
LKRLVAPHEGISYPPLLYIVVTNLFPIPTRTCGVERLVVSYGSRPLA